MPTFPARGSHYPRSRELRTRGRPQHGVSRLGSVSPSRSSSTPTAGLIARPPSVSTEILASSSWPIFAGKERFVLAASAFWIIFRFIHVVSAILWVGSAFAVFVFVEPAAAALGAEGGRFMGYMVDKRKLPVVITSLSGLTVLGGVVLYLKVSSGLDPDGISQRSGHRVNDRRDRSPRRLRDGSRRDQADGRLDERARRGDPERWGPASAEQAAAMQRLSERFKALGKVDLVLILIAAATMATARYW